MALMTAAAAGQGAWTASSSGVPGPARDFDWMAHTRATLDALRPLLHLDPGQMAAWDEWSQGVLNDAHRELDHNAAPEMPRAKGNTAFDESTPQQMARGIEHLRKHLAWMQAHLVELEAAQSRTQAFYDALDVKQKTVFDLYWHEVRHRVSGDDGDQAVYGRVYHGDDMGATMHGGKRADRESILPSGAERAP
jgi:hypothetical protein